MKEIIIKNTTKGRGIFANRYFKSGEIIEISPYIWIPPEQKEFIDQTVLFNYCFLLPDKSLVLALGMASIYNHSYKPNARYNQVERDQVIYFEAIQDIKDDEEITINYNYDPEDKTPMWFDVVN